MTGGRTRVDHEFDPRDGRRRHDRAAADQASRIIEEIVDRARRPRAGLVGDKLDCGAVGERKIAVDLDLVADAWDRVAGARCGEIEIEGRSVIERQPGGRAVRERQGRDTAGGNVGLQRAVDGQALAPLLIVPEPPSVPPLWTVTSPEPVADPAVFVANTAPLVMTVPPL